MTIPIRTFEIAVELLDSLAGLDGPREYPDRVLPSLANMIGCDVITFTEIGPDGVRHAFWPHDASDRFTDATFTQFVHQRPRTGPIRVATDPLTVAIYDVASMSEFRRLGRYAESFRPIQVDHQLSISLASGVTPIAGISLYRSRTSFTEIERQVLTIMRRPLLDALIRLRAQGAGDHQSDSGPLTGQESRILQMVAGGRTNASIATAIGISPRTVAKHLEHVYRKLQVPNRAAAAARLRREGNTSDSTMALPAPDDLRFQPSRPHLSGRAQSLA